MMIRALWSAATGMRAQQFNIDTIAHDLTNVNTTGYKKTHVNFQDLFYQSLRAAGVQGGPNNVPVGIYVGHGTRVAGTTKIFTQGGALETGIWSDMMIVDGGNRARNFFGVQMPDGTTAYTRDGSFRADEEGRLVTTDGYLLFPQPGQIPSDAVEVTITAQGVVQYRLQGQDQPQEAGQVNLYTFPNPAGLRPAGDSLFTETPASGASLQGAPGDVGFGEIRGGWLETSNVDAITEMVNMISAQRAYEFNSRSIQTSDEMLQMVNNLKR